MGYITVTTLKRYKNEDALIQLIGTGAAGSRTIDESKLESIIDDVSESIQDELTNIYTIDETDVPKLIEYITAHFVLWVLYNLDHGGIGEPEERAYKAARKALDDIKSGKTKLDADQQLVVGDGETIQEHDEASFDEDTLG